MKAFIGPILVLLVLGLFFGNIAYKDYKENQPRFAAGSCVAFLYTEGNEFEPSTYRYLKILDVGKKLYKVAIYFDNRTSDWHYSTFTSTRPFWMLNENATIIPCSEVEATFK